MTRIGLFRRDPADESGSRETVPVPGPTPGRSGTRSRAAMVRFANHAGRWLEASSVQGLAIRFAGSGIIALNLLVTAAQAEPPPSDPQQVALRGVVNINGIQVPLPPGEWALAAQVPAATETTSMLLLRRVGETVDAGVLIQAAQPGAATAWGLAPGCGRHELVFTHTRYQSNHDGSCAYVARVDDATTTTAADPAWLEGRQGITQHGWSLPRRWGVATLRVTSPRTAVQVRYFFPLERARTEWTALADWTQEIWDQVERGTHNQLVPGTSLPDFVIERPPAPPPAEAAAPEPDPATEQMQILAVRAAVATATFASYLVFLGSAWTAAGLTALSIGMPSLAAGSQDWAESWLGVTTPPLDLIGIGTELAAPG